MRILIKNGIVIDTEPEVTVLGRVDVLVEDGAIAAVAPELSGEGAEVIDASDRIVLPGFVDSHRHTWQASIRAVTPDATFGGYLQRILGELAPRHRPEDVYAGNLAGALECLDAGITTLLDWSHVQFTPAHTDSAVAALRESGIRAVFGYCHGGEPGGMAAEARRVKDTHFGTGGLLTMALAALGPEIAGEEHALAEWRLAAELGLPVTAHLGGAGPDSARKGLDFLMTNGLLATRTTFVHANHYDEEAVKVIAAHGGSVSVSPIDEMTLGIGHPISGLAMAAGMPVSLSADTVTCSPGDMFSLMRAAFAMERGRGNLGFSTRDVLRMATIGGAETVGLADTVGSLRPGKQADLVLLRTDTLGMASAHDPIGAVVLNADTGAVDTVLVAGRVVKRDGRLTGHDVPAVLARLETAARSVTS